MAIIGKSLEISESAIARTGVTGPDREAVIQKAIKTRTEWESKGQGPYRIWFGELFAEVVSPGPVPYTYRPLKARD